MKVLELKSVIAPTIVITSLFLGQTVALAYHPENEDKGKGAKNVEQKSIKYKEKLSSAVDRAQIKVDKAAQKVADMSVKKQAKEAEKPVKVKVNEDKGKGQQAKVSKADNRLKENNGRQRAFLTLSEKVNDSTRKMLKGLQNALAMISKWFGMDQAIESGEKYNKKLQEQR